MDNAQQESSADGKTLIFVTDRIENIPEGWRARETYNIVSQDEYTEVFELALPRKEFELYSESHWKRVSDSLRAEWQRGRVVTLPDAPHPKRNTILIWGMERGTLCPAARS